MPALTPKESAELGRRILLVKNSLIGRLLAPSGALLYGNEVLTHLNVLIQQPLIVLLYRDGDAGAIEYTRHFDFGKAKASRGSLDLRVGGQNSEEPFNPARDYGPIPPSVFRIFGTHYYVRVFLLDITGEDRPFYEIPTESNKTAFSYLPSPLRLVARYAQYCTKHFFTFSKEEEDSYGTKFLAEILKKLTDVLEAATYFDLEKGGNNMPAQSRRQRTQVKPKDIGRVTEQLRRLLHSKKKWLEPLDQVYKRSSFSARTLKLLGNKDTNWQRPKTYPNIFFALRSYTRGQPRAKRHLPTGEPFEGYAHDLWFSISDTQRNDMREYLEWLRDQGMHEYIKKAGGELYGDGLWNFEKYPGYANFAKSLDLEFWRILGAGASDAYAQEQKLPAIREEELRVHDGIDLLLDTFTSFIGTNSTSLVDAIFYCGASLYRMPFRRLGGLGRLHGLEAAYLQLNEVDQECFSFAHLSSEGFSELRNDCLRVVTFFYLSRMLGQANSDLSKYYTKIHLYPIDISGAIMGAVGKVSFQLKEVGADNMPVKADDWNREYLFYTETVADVQTAMVRHYRELHVTLVSKAIGSGVRRMLRRTSQLGMAQMEALRHFVFEINATIEDIARVCPLPTYTFMVIGSSRKPGLPQFDKSGTLYEWYFVRLGLKIELAFRVEKGSEIFRGSLGPGTEYFLSEHSSRLGEKVQEEVLLALNWVPRSGNVVELRGGGDANG